MELETRLIEQPHLLHVGQAHPPRLDVHTSLVLVLLYSLVSAKIHHITKLPGRRPAATTADLTAEVVICLFQTRL